MKNVLIFMSVVLLSNLGRAQQNVQIVENGSENPIPFVKIYPNAGTPFLSDLDGWFTIAPNVTSVRLSYPSYRDTTVIVADLVGTKISLIEEVQLVEEVVVVAGENPANRIMRQVIDRRKENHPLKNDAFTYTSYSKFVFDLNQDALAAIPENTTDTNLIEIRDFFGIQHLFMMESSSKRSFIPPYRDKEEILAYKVSGISDPMFSTFANSFQSFSFYENQFDILGKQYVNPIALGGIDRYLFILEDTTIVNQDTTFTIFYRPRKGKTFQGLTGRLYINTNGYAIEKVLAEPYNDSTGITLRIVQEYSFENGVKWFPSKLTTELDMHSLTVSEDVKDAYIIGRGSTYIDSLQINPEIDKRGLNDNVTIETAENAGELEESEWETLRKYEITEKEKTTYHVVDSIGKAENFGRFLRIAKILGEGKVPLGKYINLDLQRIARITNYEGTRFGLGLETSQQLIKPIQIGGYFGYGIRDKEWKYGGYSTFHLNRRKGIKFDLRYQQDLIERGGTAFHDQSMLISTEAYRNFFLSQMDRQRLGELVFSWDVKSNLTVKPFVNYQRIWFTRGYSYSQLPGASIDLAEAGFELTWNILEKSMIVGTKKVSLGKKYPQIRIKAVKGWKGIAESDINYLRLNAEINHVARVSTIGNLRWKIAAAKVFGNVPLTLAHNGNGTGQFWNVSVENTFETMPSGTFYTTEQVSVFTRLMLRPIKTKAKWNEPQFGFHHAFGYGNFENRADHAWTFETMDKGYYEGGFIFNGMITTSTASIGLGTFYKYGHYANADWKQNFVLKIVLSTLIN